MIKPRISSFKRNNFYEDTEIFKQPEGKIPSFYKNKRRGLGNMRISRPNFISPEIEPRKVISFEELQARDIEQAGIKVQLGDKTLEKLFKIEVPDETDVEWLDEYKRRLNAGETESQIDANPPFGRKQRTKPEMKNLGDQNINLEEKLNVIEKAVKQGGKDINNIILILSNTMTQAQNITLNELKTIKATLRSVFPIKETYKAFGLKNRLYSRKQYLKLQGVINLFILNNTDMKDLEYPVEALTIDKKTNKVITDISKGSQANKGFYKIGNISVGLGATKKREEGYLDVENRKIISREMAMALSSSGVDNKMLDGFNMPVQGWDISKPPSKQ